ncbi:MAG TPA: hypothetical protein DER32_11175 [Deinococcus radiodurans]|nr:hypothetical protein DXG80_07145 [Deinococcus radiodurans]HCE65568.1 hypothetical protein [Deinococcus radiodurans]
MSPPVWGLNPSGVSSSPDGYWEMDPQPVPFRMWGNWTKSAKEFKQRGPPLPKSGEPPLFI